MSADAVIGYVTITVSDKLVNRKEVRSIAGVLISTLGLSLTVCGPQRKSGWSRVENAKLQT